MKRLAVSLGTALALVGSLLAATASGGCESGTEDPCKVDTDCPQGFICREERCGALRSGDASVTSDVGIPACTSEGSACATAEECCTRACNDGRCTSATPPTPPRCRGASELCFNDCCAGLTCTSGTCR